MRQQRRGGKWMLRLSFLSVVVLLLGIYPMPASNASSLKTTPKTAVRLVDDHGDLIKNVELTAREAGSSKVRADGKAKKDGVILMSLPPGRYYFTGDVSILNSNPAYCTNLKGTLEMMQYYISPPVDITENGGEITLNINSANYIDVADIAGNAGFNLRVYQAELGINTDLHVRSNSNWVRLYLPIYKTYTFGGEEGVLHLKWPVFATPGLQFVFSAT